MISRVEMGDHMFGQLEKDKRRKTKRALKRRQRRLKREMDYKKQREKNNNNKTKLHRTILDRILALTKEASDTMKKFIMK
jgi:hypothetical protein